MARLIGITGPARHGKDTVGQMIMDLCPEYKRFAFADVFKEFLHEAFKAPQGPDENKEGTQEFILDLDAGYDVFTTSRMVKTLCEYYRNEGEIVAFRLLLWSHFMDVLIGEIFETEIEVKYTTAIIRAQTSWRQLYQLTGTEWGRNKVHPKCWIDPFIPKESCVITDVRAYGDLEGYRNAEAEAIRDLGGIVIRVEDPRKGKVIVDHASEAGISDQYVTCTIINDGSLEDLKEAVRCCLSQYL